MIGRKERRRRRRSDDWTCPDCGLEPWHLHDDDECVHEDFYVSNALWDAVCPDDKAGRRGQGVSGYGTFPICIGCLEARLGRRLRGEDFTTPPRYEHAVQARLDEMLPSARFLDRYWDGDVPEAGGYVETWEDENENLLALVEQWPGGRREGPG